MSQLFDVLSCTVENLGFAVVNCMVFEKSSDYYVHTVLFHYFQSNFNH